MNSWLKPALIVVVLAVMASYFWHNRRHVASSVAAPATSASENSEPASAEAEEANQSITVAGPLANYMLHGKPVPIQIVKGISYKETAEDRVGESPVGTRRDVLHKAIRVSGLTDVRFQLPPHSATPQLRGSFQSYPPPSDTPSNDANADISFLVLSDRQYTDFLQGRPGEPIFSAEATHNQAVDATLPPSLDRPVTYHLVFLADGAAKQAVVQTDFHIDF